MQFDMKSELKMASFGGVVQDLVGTQEEPSITL